MLSRRSLVLSGSLSAVMAALLPMGQALARSPQPPRKMPVLFIGHGSPMNAISANPFTQHLQRWGASLPRPSAILVVSAHWLTRGSTGVTVNDKLATIHDFSGFPAELHAMQYPAAGHPALAAKAAALVRSGQAQLTDQWGLDHGTWTVLHHLYPQADVPVFQVSIDYNQPAPYHYAVGKELAALREQGVLVIGSGNIVHNLRATQRDAAPNQTYDWSQEFDTRATGLLQQGQLSALSDFRQWGSIAAQAHPTYEHYLPLLYAAGAVDAKEAPRFFNTSFQAASISMRSVVWG